MTMIDYPSEVLERIVRDLQLSGMQYAVKFVGSMLFDTPVSTIMEEDKSEVANSCIKAVIAEAAKHSESITSTDRSLRKKRTIELLEIPTHERFGIYDKAMDLNIAATAISLIQYVDFGMRICCSVKMPDISLLSKGKDEYSSHFCFFAYHYDQRGQQWRRCFVFDAQPCVDEMMEVFCFALQVFRMEEEEKIKTPRKFSTNNLDKMPSIQLEGVTMQFADATNLSGSTSSGHDDTTPPVPSSSADEQLMRHNSLYATFTRTREQTAQERKRSTSRHRSTSSQRGIVEDERIANIWNQSWFHGEMQRAEAELLLKRPGQFLVRLSPNNENQFVLSGCSPEGQPVHVTLTEEDGKMCLGGRFKTIVGFICYCRQYSNFLLEKGVSLFLARPVERQSPILDDEDD